MIAFLTPISALLTGRQPLLVIAVRLIPLAIVTICSTPALVVLPLWPAGHARGITLLVALKDWSLSLQKDNNERPPTE